MMAPRPYQIATSVIPVLRYRDLPAAIDWLCRAFGFAEHRVTTASNGAVLFAQLTFGKAMVMLGPVRESAFDRLLKQPDEVGGAETQVCYFIVEDAGAHCARARAAGAEVLFNVEDEANGGHSYSCRDPEGHVWNFGTYDPWQWSAGHGRARPRESVIARALRQATLVIGLAASVVAASAIGVPNVLDNVLRELSAATPVDKSLREEMSSTPDPLAREQAARLAAERAEREMREHLGAARDATLAAERNALRASEQLAQALSEREAAEQAAREAREQLIRAWVGKTAAERSAKDARRQLARERSVRRAAESGAPTTPQRWPP